MSDLYLVPGYVSGNASLMVYFNQSDLGFRKLYIDLLDDRGNPVEGYYLGFFPEDLPNRLQCGERTQYCYIFTSAPWAGWQAAPIRPGNRYKLRLTTHYDGRDFIADTNIADVRPLAAPPTVPTSQVPGCGCPNSAGQGSVMQGLAGDPVNTVSGAYTQNDTDLTLPGFGLTFGLTRSYSSAVSAPSAFGPGWSWAYGAGVTVQSNGDVTYRAEDGSQYPYHRNGDGSFAAPAGARSVLVAVSGGYRLTTPGQKVFTFGSNGLLQSEVDARGNGLRFAYTNGVLSSITDAAGHIVQIAMSGSGTVSKATLPDGRFVEYGYTGGRLTSVRDTAGATTTYAYDSAGRLTNVTDPNNHAKVTNVYDANTGRVVEQRDAQGKVTSYGWDAAKQEARIVDPDGVVTIYGYDDGVAQYIVDGLGNRTSFRYDERLNLVLVVDPLGRQTEMAYDSAGNLVLRKAVEAGITETFTYDARNNQLTHTDPRGAKVTATFGSNDEKLTETDASGKTTRYGYDPRGLLTSVTDPLGKVTTHVYDQQGNKTSSTTPEGNRATFGYDGVGRVTATTDPRGNISGADPAQFTTTMAYDAKDRPTKTTDPLGHTTTTTYDAVGNKKTVVDSRDKTTAYDYDAGDRLITVTDPAGRAATTGYTGAGRKAWQANAKGEKTSYTYDATGRVRTQTDPRGNASGSTAADYTATFDYDAAGNQTAMSRPYPGGGMAVTRTSYDTLNRPVAVTDPLGKTSRTEYDTNGNITAQVSPLGEKTRTEYDLDSRKTATVDARGKRTAFTLDALGRKVAQIAPSGEKTTFGYDEDDRLIWTVDPIGNIAGTDPASRTTRFGYDAAGNQVSTTDPLGNQSRVDFDTAGRVTKRTDANAHTTTFGYDELNRLTSVLGADTTDPAKATKYDYDDAGQLLARTDPNGHRTTYGYDSAGRLASTTDPLGRTKQYGYDPDGHQTSIVTARGTGAGQPGGAPTEAAGTITQTYDTLGRLTTRKLGSGGPAHSFGYDANGRLTTAVDPSGTQKRGYDDAGRLTSVARGTETFQYAYDAAGNTISRTYPDGTATDSVLDDNGRVISQTTNSQTIGYSYDPAGHLTRIQYPQPTGQTESREYDAAGRLVKVSNDKITSTQASGAGFTPLSAPARILDTRDSTGGHQARLGAGEEFALTVAGVPAEATAVVLNVTGVAPSAATHIDIYPSNFTGTSTLNLAPGQVSAVAAFTALGPNKTVKVRNDAGSVDVVVDVVGYFTNSGTAGYTAAPSPVRVLDTRENIGGHQATVAPGEVVELQMRGMAGVPADATSVIVNVTGVAPSSATHLDVYGKDWGGTSTLNLDAGAVRANLAVTGIGPDGKIRIRNDAGNVHVVVDLQGWFAPNAGSRFVPLATPQRVLDTRDSTGGHQGPLGPAEQFTLSLAGKYGLPGDASAAVFNLTGVAPTSGTVLSAWPAGKTFNGASNVNIDAGKVVPNAVVSGIGTGGSVALRNSEGQIHAIVDLAGYFARPPPVGGSQVLSRFDLTLDPAGNPNKITNTRGTTTRTDLYTYDAADRVTAVCSGATSCATAPTRIGYTYDLVGNRLTQSQIGGTQAGSTSYTYDAADQLATATAPSGTVTNYSYDRDGNQTKAGADTSAYDLAGRLTAATTGGKSVAYSYDTEGNRLSSTVGTATTQYVWDINNPLPLLATEKATDASRSYRYAPGGMPVAMSTAGKSFHYGHDWLGGVRDVVSDAGVPQYAYDYQPFGDGPNADPQPLVQGAPANPMRYAGEYLDATTGLYNLRARQYAPTLGRFTAVDPVPSAVTSPYPSAYLYAGGKATTAVDPSGNCWWLPWSDDGSGCPGAQAARNIGNAAAGVGKGIYHTAEGALNSVLHPIDSLQAATESCWEGFKDSLYMGCIGNTLGIYQLFGIGQKCPPNFDTTELADHITQVGLGIVLLGRGGLKGRAGPTDPVHVYRAPQRGNGPDELANGLNPARHSEPGGRAYVGTEDVAQKYADYMVGSHEDGYIRFTFDRSDFEESFGPGFRYEGGPGREWEIAHGQIDLFNRLTKSREWFDAQW